MSEQGSAPAPDPGRSGGAGGRTTQRREQYTNPIESAHELAEVHGIPIFPCNADKTPLTEHGFHDATTDPKVIAAWWHRHPDALVGVPTGERTGLVIVDVDPDGAQWYTDNVIDLACGRVHRTRRGWHLLYRHPGKHVPSRNGYLAPGVDVKADGG